MGVVDGSVCINDEDEDGVFGLSSLLTTKGGVIVGCTPDADADADVVDESVAGRERLGSGSEAEAGER